MSSAVLQIASTLADAHTCAMNSEERLKVQRAFLERAYLHFGGGRKGKGLLAKASGVSRGLLTNYFKPEYKWFIKPLNLKKIADASGQIVPPELLAGVEADRLSPNDSAINPQHIDPNGDNRSPGSETGDPMQPGIWETVKALREQYGEEFDMVVKATKPPRPPRGPRSSFTKRRRKTGVR